MDLDLQKAGICKRISAFLFDIIMLTVVIAGAGFFLSEILNYDSYVDSLEGFYDEYEQSYGVEFEITQQQYIELKEEDKIKFDDAYNALSKDKKVMSAYSMVINLTLIIISLSTLIGYLILEFIIPLCFKNGQTLGKKIFGIGVMHTSGIQITPMLLFIRTILGKYTLETMVPILIILMIFLNVIGFSGTVILGVFFIFQLLLAIFTKTNSFLHDILAKTVVIDISSQRIFKDGAELLEYNKKLYAEKAERQEY